MRFNPALLHACLHVRRIASLSRNAFSRSFHRGGTLRRFWSIGGPVSERGGSSVTSAAAAALRAQQQKSRRASCLSAVVDAAPGGGKSALPSSVSMASVVSMRGGEGAAEERPDLGFGLKLTLSIITITFCES